MGISKNITRDQENMNMKHIFCTLLLLAVVLAAPAAADDWFVQLDGGGGQGFGAVRTSSGGSDFSFVTNGIGNVSGVTIGGTNVGGTAAFGSIAGTTNASISPGANVVVTGAGGSVSGTLELAGESGGGPGPEPGDGLEDDTTDPCVAGTNTVCLRGGRFEVTATYSLQDQRTGDMGGDNATDDTGQLYFFNQSNVEVFIKVLDACNSAEPNFWVFISGLTNQGVVLKVRDSVAGKSRTYENPLGTTFVTVTGTTPEGGSFPTCDG